MHIIVEHNVTLMQDKHQPHRSIENARDHRHQILHVQRTSFVLQRENGIEFPVMRVALAPLLGQQILE